MTAIFSAKKKIMDKSGTFNYMLFRMIKMFKMIDYLQFFLSGCVGAEWVVLTVTIPVIIGRI